MRYLILLMILAVCSIALAYEPDSSATVSPEINRKCDELAGAMVADAFIAFGGEIKPAVKQQLLRSLRKQLDNLSAREISRSEKLKQIIREHAEMKRIIDAQKINNRPKPPRKPEGEPCDPDKALRDAVEQGFPDGESYFGVS